MKKLENSFTKTEILELAREFKRRRNFLGLSQLKLAKLANLSQSIINKFESGKIDPTLSTVLKIEKALEEQENISNLCAKDVMVKDILYTKPSAMIFETLELMRKNDFSQLLVMDSREKLIGVVYEKNILDAISQKVDIYKTPIKTILDINPIIIPEKYPVSELSFIFQNKKTKFVLVGGNGVYTGLVTKSDLFMK